MSDVRIRRFDDQAWADEAKDGNSPPEMVERARAAGYRRKRLLAGENDVFLTYVEMGPNFTVEPHSHDAGEVIHLVRGSLTPSGADAPLTAGDSLVVPAGEVYGFSCGQEGVAFLIYRPADAGIDHVEPSTPE